MPRFGVRAASSSVSRSIAVDSTARRTVAPSRASPAPASGAPIAAALARNSSYRVSPKCRPGDTFPGFGALTSRRQASCAAVPTSAALNGSRAMACSSMGDSSPRLPDPPDPLDPPDPPDPDPPDPPDPLDPRGACFSFSDTPSVTPGAPRCDWAPRPRARARPDGPRSRPPRRSRWPAAGPASRGCR